MHKRLIPKISVNKCFRNHNVFMVTQNRHLKRITSKTLINKIQKFDSVIVEEEDIFLPIVLKTRKMTKNVTHALAISPKKAENSIRNLSSL